MWTLAFNRSDTVTLNFAIAGTGVVQQMGTGLMSVTTPQAYSGGTPVSGGTFRLDAGGSLNAAAALTIDGGTFDLNGHSQTVNRLSGAGGTLALGAGTLTIANTSGTSGTLASTITGMKTIQGKTTNMTPMLASCCASCALLKAAPIRA